MSAAFASVVAALAWDPQVRGFVIVLTAFVILIGSVYLLLATNTGARLGFLLAAAGFTGWCALMGWIWVIYGIGIRGDDPHWEVEEIVTGELAANSGVDVSVDFPEAWEKLEEGDPILGDARAAADAALLPASAEAEGGHGGGGGEATTTHAPVFEEAGQFVHVGGYRTGGEDYWIPGGYLERSDTPFRGWLHQPHYAIIQVQAAEEVPEGETAPAEPEVDESAPVVSVVMLRNLGTLRQPSAFFGLANTIAFAVFCFLLHRRDKEIHARRTAATAPA